MGEKEFKIKHKEFCNRYNESLDLYYRCSEYCEDSKRTPQEIDKYTKILSMYSVILSKMLIEYKELNGQELSNRITLGGFIFYEQNT
ncbi:MAG TPA: hypothetical protein VIK72_19580 [Clostridiaceae bacterium]